MHKWFQNEKEKALNSQFPQVKFYARNKQINLEVYINDYIRSWIYRLQKIQKKVETISPKDIRSFIR